jgi:hypothetical protein
MTSPKDNVQRLRQAGVLPQWVTLTSANEDAINALSQEEVDTVLAVHSKVGQIESPGPQFVIKIF